MPPMMPMPSGTRYARGARLGLMAKLSGKMLL
jgi:hypothetical protein